MQSLKPCAPVKDGGVRDVGDEELVKCEHIDVGLQRVRYLDQRVRCALAGCQARVDVEHEIVEMGASDLR